MTWRVGQKLNLISLPSRELTYPNLGKGKSSSRVPWDIELVLRRVILVSNEASRAGLFHTFLVSISSYENS